jgi:hypothetical protein
VHPAALFAGNRWRPAGLTRARLRPAAKAIKHRAAGIEFIDENAVAPACASASAGVSKHLNNSKRRGGNALANCALPFVVFGKTKPILKFFQ